VIGRKGWKWETLLAADKGDSLTKVNLPPKKKKDTKKRNLHTDDGSQGSEQGKQGCA